ncbi:MAG TPA: hypothetical protein VHU18_00220 [Rhizomicrobium sp.]|nr:hypothetical protein [Rhizomicrobium sp.]
MTADSYPFEHAFLARPHHQRGEGHQPRVLRRHLKTAGDNRVGVMNISKNDRTRKTGTTGPLSLGPKGPTRQLVKFPGTKEANEEFIARLFCAGKSGMNPQIKRYGSFSKPNPQRENSLDFRVRTELGPRWLELVEFAPLNQFKGRYESVPGKWAGQELLSLLMRVIQNKANKHYGSDVILVIYKTHETLALPPPIIRLARKELQKDLPPFESIYFLSPHDQQCASAWEILPGDPTDNGPEVADGTFHIGFGGFKYSDET